MKPSLVQEGNILKRQLFKVFLNVRYYMNRKITCPRLRNEKGGTDVISSSETRPFLFQPVKRLRKAGIYKKLFRVTTVSPGLIKGEVKSRLGDTSNAATHLYFSFSHHKTRNLFTCSCFSLVHLKEKENALIGVSLCYVKPIFVLLPRMKSCKLRECSYSPHYCVYYLLNNYFGVSYGILCTSKNYTK